MKRIAILLLMVAPWGFATESRILVSVAPLHSLVASMTLGITQPDLLLSAAITPHHFHLKPSQRRAIANADLVIWVGPELETPLSGVLNGAGVNSLSVTGLSASNPPQSLALLPLRSDLFDDHGHDQDDDHEQPGELSGLDPHFWLDPNLAIQFVKQLLHSLIPLYPAQESQLVSNTQALVTALETSHQTWQSQLAPLAGKDILTAHDGFQYFEQAFKLRHAGAIQPNTDVAISVKRALTLRNRLSESVIGCVFIEPQINSQQLTSLLGDLPIGVATLDPMGVQQPVGPNLYQAMMQANVDAVSGCFDP